MPSTIVQCFVTKKELQKLLEQKSKSLSFSKFDLKLPYLTSMATKSYPKDYTSLSSCNSMPRLRMPMSMLWVSGNFWCLSSQNEETRHYSIQNEFHEGVCFIIIEEGEWNLYFDGSSTVSGVGVEIVLIPQSAKVNSLMESLELISSHLSRNNISLEE